MGTWLQHLMNFSCLQDILGARFHCAICDSIDICSNCESAGLPGNLDSSDGGHISSHIMIKVSVIFLRVEHIAHFFQDSLSTWNNRSANGQPPCHPFMDRQGRSTCFDCIPLQTRLCILFICSDGRWLETCPKCARWRVAEPPLVLQGLQPGLVLAIILPWRADDSPDNNWYTVSMCYMPLFTHCI